MRFAFVALACLACSLTTVGAQSAGVDATLAAPKTDVTKPAPPPTNVNVLNWPESQTVTGSVSVDVRNLPLDTDGTLRVTTPPQRQLAVHELVSGSVEPSPDCECYVWIDCWCTTMPISIDATGYSKVGAFVRTDVAGSAVFELLWRWSDDEPFRRVQNALSGVSFRGNSGEPYVYPGIGGTVALHVEWYTGTVIESARVYLIP